VGLALGVHSLFVDDDEQVDVARSVSGASRDATEQDYADVVAYSFFETGEDRSDRCVILRLWNGCYRIVSLDEHLCVHPNSIRSARSVDGDHAEILERTDGGIHTTQSFARHAVEFSIGELSLWIIHEDMQNIGGGPVSEGIRITEWNGESDV
jgi:hypothetical protein